MARRSLQLSPKGIHIAKQAFSIRGWTQENLANEINIKTRQPIWRFFTGQPVDRYIFLEICSTLDLNCREIADTYPAEFRSNEDIDLGNTSPKTNGLANLVKEVRSLRFDKIQNQCGILQMLDMSSPISLEQIYIDVNILEAVSNQQRLAIADLENIDLQAVDQPFERLGMGAISQLQISGMRAVEKYAKLRVLGKPGTGKTTFLQHLAIQCNHARFMADFVPVFITLRDFVEESKSGTKLSLLNYLRQEFATCGVSDGEAIETLLKEGKVLILLDGMDEILHQDSVAMVNEIRKFSETYHKNRFVATCRIAATNLSLRGFTDVEIAPFSQVQTESFVQRWFTAFSKVAGESGKSIAAQFLQKLNEPSNSQFHFLTTTPLFLHLACWVFLGQGKFPVKHSDFYRQGLDVLLGKWDEARGVERDEVYRGFLLPQKLKLLSHLAAVTFENGKYFFSCEVIEGHISDYLRSLPDASDEIEEIQQQSKDILRAIESQHGILTERSHGVYSFSYLVFQEYLTARKIVCSSKNSQAALIELVNHLGDRQWREIFLLTAGMLKDPTDLIDLIKIKVQALIQDPYIQEFLDHQDQIIRNISQSMVEGEVISKDWLFSPEQGEVLENYYECQQLLLDCLGGEYG